MAIFPRPNDPIIRELREIRKRHAVLEEADPEAWAKRLREAGALTRDVNMLPLPNFDDPLFDEVRRGTGTQSKSKPKPRPSKQAKRGKVSKRAALKRSSR